MRSLKYLVLVGVMGAVAAPAFASTKAQSTTTWVAKKKKEKKMDEKCDGTGKACTEGDDCKPMNCHPAEPAPAPAPAPAPQP